MSDSLVTTERLAELRRDVADWWRDHYEAIRADRAEKNRIARLKELVRPRRRK